MSTDQQEQQALDALVDTYSEPGSARLLLELAGFPPGRIPAFSTSMVFWSRVASEARNGLLPGGVRPIFEQAARQYPNNPAFAPYAPPTSSTTPLPGTTQTPMPKPAPAGPIRIFVSYSHKDPTYLEQLETRLGLQDFVWAAAS